MLHPHTSHNTGWNLCCRHMRRRCRQTLFFSVIVTCGFVIFVGESAIRRTSVDSDVIFTVPSSKVELPAAINDDKISGYLELVGKVVIQHQVAASKQNISTVIENGIIVPLNVNPPKVAINMPDEIKFSKDSPSAFSRWKNSMTTACYGQLRLFGREFAHLSHVVVDRNFCQATARGGEPVESVINQNEKAEYYNILPSCFQLDCGRDIMPLRTYRFNGAQNYLNDWMRSLRESGSESKNIVVDHVETTFTIAITRHEYANLYHTLTDWYNAFLVMKFFDKLPNETNILFVDAHPQGHLDDAWRRIFNHTYFLSELPMRTRFSELVWGVQGYNSLIKDNFGPDLPPFMEEFRSFFLSPFNIRGQNRTLNCSSIAVTFLWRRDYVAHPRNPTGVIQRKIENEEEILQGVRQLHPDFRVKGIQLDAYGMADQLQIIADTDVLIGMHGAGMSHVVFLPVHGAMVEMFPSYYEGLNRHMGDLARWRGMTNFDWHSSDRFNELAGYRTRVPVNIVSWLLDLATAKICRRPEPKPSFEISRAVQGVASWRHHQVGAVPIHIAKGSWAPPRNMI